MVFGDCVPTCPSVCDEHSQMVPLNIFILFGIPQVKTENQTYTVKNSNKTDQFESKLLHSNTFTAISLKCMVHNMAV